MKFGSKIIPKTYTREQKLAIEMLQGTAGPTITLIFRRSKFSRIAVFENFVEIMGILLTLWSASCTCHGPELTYYDALAS